MKRRLPRIEEGNKTRTHSQELQFSFLLHANCFRLPMFVCFWPFLMRNICFLFFRIFFSALAFCDTLSSKRLRVFERIWNSLPSRGVTITPCDAMYPFCAYVLTTKVTSYPLSKEHARYRKANVLQYLPNDWWQKTKWTKFYRDNFSRAQYKLESARPAEKKSRLPLAGYESIRMEEMQSSKQNRK